MKWKDRILFILFAVFMLVVFKFFAPIRKQSFHDDVTITKRYIKEINGAKLDPDGHSQWEGKHAWYIWQQMATADSITNVPDYYVDKLLDELSTAKLIKVDVGQKGSQLKATLYLDGPTHQKVVFKPKRYSRDEIFEGIYEGMDRHNGEIAAFHLDRLLGFYRAPLVVGRYIDLKKELYPVASKKLKNTFFDKGNDVCFYGVCRSCRRESSACANNGIMEGSVTIWLPSKGKLLYTRHPYQRTYRNNLKALWETKNICESIMIQPPYDTGRRLLDLLDSAIFDFIIGNGDRHHYESFKLPDNNNDALFVNLDNGKSFGNPFRDEMSILAPLTQCCIVRRSTFSRLKKFLSPGKMNSLSHQLEFRLKKDPIYPILNLLHLTAIDRRLKVIHQEITKCVEEKGEAYVLRDTY